MQLKKSVELTFAGLHAFRPAVTDIFIADPSAVLIPSAARSAATDSTGPRERPTVWTLPRTSNRWVDDLRCG